MTTTPKPDSFFSVSLSLITTTGPLTYDLFVNASAVEGRERFVRIFPQGESLSETDLLRFKDKYKQLYVPEKQRGLYLSSICSSSGKDVKEKTTVLKDSAIHYLENIFDPKKEFSTEVLNEVIGGCREVVGNFVEVLNDLGVDDLKSLIGNLSFHDFYTFDHSINVSMYSIMIYRAVKPDATKTELTQAGLGGLLHDIGKLKIPTDIINKPDKLTEEEFKEIQKHPDYGIECLCESGIEAPEGINLMILSRVVHEHHENFDGTGYPSKIQGEEIHLLARVTAIADFFDAITTKRSYHKPLSTSDALMLMSKTAGKKIDPELFQVFLRTTNEFDKSKEFKFEISGDFDPCQPQQMLPLKRSASAVAAVKDHQYGKIKLVGSEKEFKDWAHKSNVDLVDPNLKKKINTK